jgi:CRISPR-associated protein Cas1
MKRVIYIFREDGKISLSNGNVVIKKGDDIIKYPINDCLAINIVGRNSITTSFIEFCKKNGVAIFLLNDSLKLIGNINNNNDSNFIVRKKQYLNKNDLKFAKLLIYEKIMNQKRLIEKKQNTIEDEYVLNKINKIDIRKITTDKLLLQLEGYVSKMYFSSVFKNCEWNGREKRNGKDKLNVLLDRGYSHLYNFLETLLVPYGFDLYFGVFHKEAFKRKSLICDLVEPFRSVIDEKIIEIFENKIIEEEHFYYDVVLKRYSILPKYNEFYTKHFVETLMLRKDEMLSYVKNYYYYFMEISNKEPKFIL